MNQKHPIPHGGDRFGQLVLITKAKSGERGESRWWCRCDCGNEKEIRQKSLCEGLSRSCGCVHRTIAKRLFTIHGHCVGNRRSPEHNSWHAMIERCENKRSVKYKDYGGRGIKVHLLWRQSFQCFLSYLKSTIGLRLSPKHSIDRINNDGNYEPGNIRWATQQQQQNNKRRRSNHERDIATKNIRSCSERVVSS